MSQKSFRVHRKPSPRFGKNMNDKMLLEAREIWYSRLVREKLLNQGNPQWTQRHVERLDSLIIERKLSASDTSLPKD